MDDVRVTVIGDSTFGENGTWMTQAVDDLQADYPTYTMNVRTWVQVPNGFWRSLLGRPERGYYSPARRA